MVETRPVHELLVPLHPVLARVTEPATVVTRVVDTRHFSIAHDDLAVVPVQVAAVLGAQISWAKLARPAHKGLGCSIGATIAQNDSQSFWRMLEQCLKVCLQLFLG